MSFSRPSYPFFSSGPTKKYPTYTASALETALTSRSHRHWQGKERIQSILELTHKILEIPADYKVAVIPGSGTGAIECALWSFLGSRGVDVFSWDAFGKLWLVDILQQLKLSNVRVFEASNWGELPELSSYNPQNDAVFTWNGTSSGVCLAQADWIPDNREGLTLCDATSAAFCVPLPWTKLDVTTFSWQKGLGGEGAHGMMVLSPRALEQLQIYTPSWPIPRIFRFMKNNQLNYELFEGATLNTPSMICIEDYYQALKWAQSIGGLSALYNRCQSNFLTLANWIEKSRLCYLISRTPKILSPSVVFTFIDPEKRTWETIKQVEETLFRDQIAYDIVNLRAAPPSFRIWCGPTIERDDMQALLPWLDYAFKKALSR